MAAKKADKKGAVAQAVEVAPDVDVVSPDTEVVAEGVVPTDPDEALRAKYRDAMSRKQASSAAGKTGRSDGGGAGPASSGGPTQRLFRRKAGG